MDLPILQYLDILIGLSVVMLLAATVVTGITQLFLNSSYARSRYLSDGLSQLVAQLHPSLLAPYAQYIAQRLLRHPLAGRSSTWIGRPFTDLRNLGRQKITRRLPLPPVNPGDVLQREEFILMLMEWAAGQGPLAHQDEELSAKYPGFRKQLPKIREQLRKALLHGGIGDPAGTAKQVRLLAAQNQDSFPQIPSHVWFSRAMAQAAMSDMVAKVHAWYDNTVARISDNFSLEAKIATSAVTLLVCFLLQLDTVSLLRRLTVDDKFRDALVKQADAAEKRYEQLRQKTEALREAEPRGAQPPAAPTAELEKLSQDARKELDLALGELRDSKLGILPPYFFLSKVAQARFCIPAEWARSGDFSATLEAGPQESPLRFSYSARNPAEFLAQLSQAIRATKAPVELHRNSKSGCVQIVAQRPDIERVWLRAGGNWAVTPQDKGIDWRGAWSRLPGVLLSWILVSLGAPFWYDLLKRLMGFRSLLAQKDDKDRTERQQQQAALAPAAAGPTPAPAGPSAEHDDEAGDLNATGAQG